MKTIVLCLSFLVCFNLTDCSTKIPSWCNSKSQAELSVDNPRCVLDLSGNFEGYLDEEGELPTAASDEVLQEILHYFENNVTTREDRATPKWEGYPFLYRVLCNSLNPKNKRKIEEGDGSEGIISRSLLCEKTRPPYPPFPKKTVERHVACNAHVTPFISTSTNEKKQRDMAKRALDKHDVTYVNIAKIDASRINPDHIINLSDEGERNRTLTSDKARNFARVWFEVLIFWEIPAEAVIGCMTIL